VSDFFEKADTWRMPTGRPPGKNEGVRLNALVCAADCRPAAAGELVEPALICWTR
jgi:hypothetical protein